MTHPRAMSNDPLAFVDRSGIRRTFKESNDDVKRRCLWRRIEAEQAAEISKRKIWK